MLSLPTVGICVVLALVYRHWRGVRVPADPWDGEDLGLDADATGVGGRAVCTSCLADNDPSTAFCCQCGNPIGDTSSLDPLKRIWAQGWVYRRAVASPYRLRVVIGMWLVFLPYAILPLVFLSRRHSWSLADAVLTMPLGIIALAVLAKVTINYVRHRGLGDTEA